MGDRDRLVDIDIIHAVQDANLSHAQIYSLERYIWPRIVSEQTRYSFVEIFVSFIKRRPTSDLELIFKDEAGVKHKSQIQARRPCSMEPRHVRPLRSSVSVSSFSETDCFLCSHVIAYSCATLTIQRALLKITVAQIEIEFKPNEFGDYTSVGLEGWGLCFRIKCPST